jgi:ribose-phosphate pyrophosphokinase
MIEIIKYPDGQLNVKANGIEDKLFHRINSYEDLIVLKSIADSPSVDTSKIDLYIPCLFGQRSDRRFTPDESFGLKIICDIINSCNFRKVNVLDPHSYVSIALLNNGAALQPDELIEVAYMRVKSRHNTKDIVFVSPDAGAYKKVFRIANKLDRPLVAANKFRDEQGEISLNILYSELKDKVCLIIDDILDGGHTFHILAEKLKTLGASHVYVYVTHAYFSKGVDFSEHIDGFFCTNSVKDIDHEKVSQITIEKL